MIHNSDVLFTFFFLNTKCYELKMSPKISYTFWIFGYLNSYWKSWKCRNKQSTEICGSSIISSISTSSILSSIFHTADVVSKPRSLLTMDYGMKSVRAVNILLSSKNHELHGRLINVIHRKSFAKACSIDKFVDWLGTAQWNDRNLVNIRLKNVFQTGIIFQKWE